MSFIYYKLPYKNKLLEPAVTKQQVSQDKVVFKPRAFQDTCDALAFWLRVQQSWSLSLSPERGEATTGIDTSRRTQITVLELR